MTLLGIPTGMICYPDEDGEDSLHIYWEEEQVTDISGLGEINVYIDISSNILVAFLTETCEEERLKKYID